MKYYIIVGEASGDLHASNMMKSLKIKDPNAEFRFWGGDLMQAQGGTLVKHYRDLAFMGFAEVIMNLRTILKNIAFCKKDLLAYNPDKLILVDYPGFNMRIAEFAKKNKIEVHYYISPQIWAWKENRIHKIKRDVDAMYVILPFEKPYYQDKHQFNVHFVGHPLLDAIDDEKSITIESFREEYDLDNRPIIALLPGSRKQEINKMLSVMLEMVAKFKAYQFVIAGAPSQEFEVYQPYLKNYDVKFISNKTYELLSNSYAAIVTSGTATLETALFKVPQIVCYKANAISFWIAKQLVKLKYISLVNLIMDKEVVVELLQDDFTKERLTVELEKIINESYRKKLFGNYFELEKMLGGKGASDRIAELITSKE